MSNKELKIGMKVCVRDFICHRTVRGNIDGYVPTVGFSLDVGGVFLFRKEGKDWEFVKTSLENK